MPLFVLVCACVAIAADDNRAQIEFFESRIRPVLVKHCYECHSADSDVVQGGLRLDHPHAMARGGDSGAAVKPGKPEKSLLLAAIRYDDMEMPPAGKLSDKVVKDFEKWIELGAVDPRADDPIAEVANSEIDWDVARKFWAFQPPKKHAPPKINDATWPSGKIDAFILAQLEQAGIQPNQPADRRALIRRLSFDLVGLPPTVDDVNRFVEDNRPGAVGRLVDRLLHDPQYAERWARMWMDVVRYAEDQAHIVGKNDSLIYPNAFRYRDWLIGAIAKDMPYDEFVRVQLAADLIDPDDKDSHIALGFLGLGPKYYRRNDPSVMADEWEDRVDVVSRGLLGLTVACARCHDHKFDPIPTSDYYALAGVFAGTEMFNRAVNDKVDQKNGQAKKPQNAVHIVREGKPRDLNIMVRGDANAKGPLAPRGFLTALTREPTRFTNGSGRADLADAIVDRNNPLTARVIVNRFWMQLMGSPLVGTPSNFGALGDKSTHPQLLDDLSVRFMENRWSLKWLQREIVLSSTYQQSSEIDAAKSTIDPENQLRWRMPRRRLSAEGYRDALLSVSDRLSTTIGGPSIKTNDAESVRRTVYSKVSRLGLNPMLARFDFPDPNAHSAGRYETTTPLQKLFLLNSPFLVKQSDAMAKRLAEQTGSRRSKIEAAYQMLYARMPSKEEIQWGESFIDAGDDVAKNQAAWIQYVQALLISNEMFVID